MSVHVFKFIKRVKETWVLLIRYELYKFNNTRAQVLGSIYRLALRLL